MLQPADFARRRRALIGALGPGCAAIVPASPVRVRSRDVDYPYRPDTNLLYLTSTATASGSRKPVRYSRLVSGRYG